MYVQEGAACGDKHFRGLALIDKLRFLVRFWDLTARHAMNALASAEKLELHALLKVATQDARLPPRGIVSRTPDSIAGELIGEFGFVRCELRQVNAAGFVVAGYRGIKAGTSLILRVSDELRGVDYAIPCSVVWTHEIGTSTMALKIDGTPTETSFTSLSRISLVPRQAPQLMA